MTPTRRALAWAGGTLGALVIALAVGEASGWPFLRQPLQDAMSRAATVPVSLEGRFRTHLLWRPRLEIERLNVAPGGGAAVPHLLDARTVELGWRWRDVWRWRRGEGLRIERLRAEQLSANLVRDAAGRASWQIGPGRDTPPDAATPMAGVPRFGSLQVGSGHIVVDDHPLATQLTVDLKGSEGAPGAAYDATVTGRYRNLPLALRLHTTGTLPLMHDALGEIATTPVPLRVEGQAGAAQLRFEGSASALLGERRLQGTLRFSGPSLAQVGAPLGLTLPQTPPFALNGTLGHADGVWQLHADRATIGRSQLDGDFRFDPRATPPRLTGRLGGTRLAFADLGPAVGTAAPGRPPAATPKAPADTPRKVLPQRRFDLPSLAVMDADVQVAIDELDFGSEAVAPLRQLRTHLVLQGSVLRLQDLQAVVAGGQFGGDTQLDARSTPPQWAADLRFSGIDVAGWLRGVRSAQGRAEAPRATNTAGLKQQRNEARQGGERPVRAYLTGTLGGTVKATGRGRSTAEILATLDGQAQLMLRDGTVSHLVTELAGLDLAQALGVWVRNDNPLPLRCARVDLAVQQGIVRPRLAVLDNRDSTARVSGVVNLRDETLALQATTKPKDFSPLALRSPVTVGGTLGQPVVGVKGAPIAAKVLGALALGATFGPLAALLPLVDTGLDDSGDPCVQPPGQSPAGAPAPPPAATAKAR